MFEKVSRSLKYDSNIFFRPQTHIYIYIWTPQPITLPRSRCACGVKSKHVSPLKYPYLDFLSGCGRRRTFSMGNYFPRDIIFQARFCSMKFICNRCVWTWSTVMIFTSKINIKCFCFLLININGKCWFPITWYKNADSTTLSKPACF